MACFCTFSSRSRGPFRHGRTEKVPAKLLRTNDKHASRALAKRRSETTCFPVHLFYDPQQYGHLIGPAPGLEIGRATLDGWVMRVGELLQPVVAATGRYSFKRRPWRVRSMFDHNSRLNWVTVGALALFHAGALAAFFLFTWQALWIALALLWISGGWGIGMGYHRLLTHRGYETPRWPSDLAPLRHARSARRPYLLGRDPSPASTNSDKSGDRHSPRDGWWWSHAGGRAERPHARRGTRAQRPRPSAIPFTDGWISGT